MALAVMGGGLRTFSTKNLGRSLNLSEDRLTIGYMEAQGRRSMNESVECLQASLAVPLCVWVDYYEVVVRDPGEHGLIGIGFASPQFEPNKQPGWTSDSYGYHGDDGFIYHSSIPREYGPPFTIGDVIGAGFNHATHEIFFTKNGKNLGMAFRGVVATLVPTVGLQSKGAVVEANFGQQHFLFDTEELQRMQEVPTRFSTETVGRFLVVSPDKRAVKWVGDDGDEVGAIQADQAVPGGQASYYYEVTVKDQGLHCYIGIGFASPNYHLGSLPGWKYASFGYHGDDGKAYQCKSPSSNYSSHQYGPTFTTGDVIGAGINYASREIFFTKNGKYLGVAVKGFSGALVPTVGMQSPDEQIEANFGDRPFLFDGKGLRMIEGEPSKFCSRSAAYPLQIDPNNLIIRYVGHDGGDVAGAQADQLVPFCCEVYYYEITVRNQGRQPYIGVGFAAPGFLPNLQPGWTSSSYGYHGDDGFAHNSATSVPYGPTFSTGDVIGAGYNHTTHQIFFTKNGRYLGPAFPDVGGELVPTVGLHSPGIVLEANFGQRPFLFDMQAVNIQGEGWTLSSTSNVPVHLAAAAFTGASSTAVHNAASASADLRQPQECARCKQMRPPAVKLSLCGHTLDDACGMFYGAVGRCFCGANFSASEMRRCYVDPLQINLNVRSRDLTHIIYTICQHCDVSFPASPTMIPMICLPPPHGCGRSFSVGTSPSLATDSPEGLVAPGGVGGVVDTPGREGMLGSSRLNGGPPGGSFVDKTCAICFAAEKNAVFVPCGHVSCCFECASLCVSSPDREMSRPVCPDCPVCRGRVEQVVRIYL